MNYIKQLNAFHRQRLKVGLSPMASWMYTVLLNIANRAAKGHDWLEWSPISLTQLAREVPASRPTVCRLKQELEAGGLVKVRKARRSNNGNDCDLWHIIPLYEPQETQAAARQAKEAVDDEQARQIMVSHPDGLDVQQGMIAIGFPPLEAARMLDEGGVELCRTILGEACRKADKSPRGLYLTIYRDRVGALDKARQAQAAVQNAQERQQSSQEFVPPVYDPYADIA